LLGSSTANNIKLFSYSELKSGTDNFHPRNKIGRGGFGTVYKVCVVTCDNRLFFSCSS